MNFNNLRPNISTENALDHALDQAGMTIDQYMGRAINLIDSRFGDGYSREHSELVGQLVQSQAMDFNSTVMTAALYEIADRLDQIASK
jgi:hypothetical protein